jgi:hypothetical protein
MMNKGRKPGMVLVTFLIAALSLEIGVTAQVAASKPTDGEIILTLTDGSIVRGTTSTRAIEVQTIYGRLTVPISDISRARFAQDATMPSAGQDEVDTRAFFIRGAINLDVLELKTPNGTLRIARANIISLAAAWSPIETFAAAAGVVAFPGAGFSSSAESPIRLGSRDSSSEPVAGERLLSTFTFEGSFHVYGHEPVPQQNGFDYYLSPVTLDSALRGKRVRVSRVEVSVKGKSNGAVVNWDLEVFAGAAGTLGLPSGQFTKTLADPMYAYQPTAPIHTRFTYGEVNYVRSVTIPQAPRRDVSVDDGLRAQVFLWTADNRNCNLTIQTVSVRFFGETL